MPTSVYGPEVTEELNQARRRARARGLTPSPEDWRDLWIYFLLVDRFNNPAAPPRHLPHDAAYGGFQGGTIDGIRQRLDYLKRLGVGAIWVSPVLRNCLFLDGQPNEGTYHGYGIRNFLQVDPRFATDARQAGRELRHLVDEAHARGIYVVLDIVLNHVGDVFAYPTGSEAPFGESPYSVRWRDEQGIARAEWPSAGDIAGPPSEAGVLPVELRRDEFYRRQGGPDPAASPLVGDFGSLKQLLTANKELGGVLIRSFQYLIARYDIDGLRIDTLKYLDHEFALTFGNAIREFALSIGKKNFFTFGEVYDDEHRIAEFIGRRASAGGDLVGVDAALDFPLFFTLPAVAKGMLPPAELARLYRHRKEVQRDVISSHGEATRFFVTFLDNHDQHQRIHVRPEGDAGRFDHQATLGFGCLFALPGIPCLYYGTEQGLHASGDSDQYVREAIWGKPSPFDAAHPFYAAIQRLTAVRNEHAALRYGRFYFRPVSGDGAHFGVSTTPEGVLAFSRILNDQEVVVIANTSTRSDFVGFVLIDAALNRGGDQLEVLFTNHADVRRPGPARTIDAAQVEDLDGGTRAVSITALPVSLRPMEIQILGIPLG